MKFSIGSKVRVTKPIVSPKRFKGKVGVVCLINRNKYLVGGLEKGKSLPLLFYKDELSPIKPKAKKEKTLRQDYARTRKVLKNAFREVEEETKKEGKIERLRYLDKEVISPIIDILEKYDLKTNRGNLLALGRILIFILKKQRELNSLLDAFNSTKEEVK